jgi:pyruvate dehydrogenase E2 component (dihydrolipoamide acetyltransferase)
MPHPITIPRLGWSMEEGIFGEWLKPHGEPVRAGDMLFVLEGEKAAHEIESLDSGILCIPADAPQPGTTVKVGEVIGFLLAEGETAPATVRVPPTTTAPIAASQTHAPVRRTSSPSSLEINGLEVRCTSTSGKSTSSALPSVTSTMPRAAGPAARRLARELGIDLNAVFTPDPTGRVLCEDVQSAAASRNQSQSGGTTARNPVATPRAKRRARELGIDWTRLAGTGRGGRIRERDILTAKSDSPLPIPDSPSVPGRFVPASKLRQIIAQRMSAGVHQAVPVTLTTKVDVDSLVAYRERLKHEAVDGLVPSFNDIVIQQAAQTLRELPDLNACWQGHGIHHFDAVHIATAVDTPAGLLAPVVRDADQLTLPELAARTRGLVEQARAGTLTQDQLSGGTFTVSNLGMLGIDAFTPVLNLPQAAILGVGRIVEEPVVRDGQLAAGKTMTLSLTFDHRVIDGAPAARWLQRLCERLHDSVGKSWNFSCEKAKGHP